MTTPAGYTVLPSGFFMKTIDGSGPYAVDANGTVCSVGQDSSSIQYDEIIDTTSNVLYNYHCEALPGTLTSAAAWRISRLTLATGLVRFADGNSAFDNIADDRATTQVY